MKQIKSLNVKRGLPLLLALSILLTSCGGGASAATMHLRKTEGTVGVSDGGGKDVEPRNDLGLYSGYGVDTQAESYAWIDLDDVKLTKLDQDSEIAITKEGKKLEIEVKTGSLFFNVTEPLADDESMNIRTSTMAVGIRGTCGWVTQDTAALLEGTVEVTAGEQSVTVTAGEMVVLTADGELEVIEFFAGDVPAFVAEEVEDEFQLEPAPEPEPDPVELALEQYRVIAGQADTYDYDSVDSPTGAYRYALVRMNPADTVPALLLEQDTTFGISSVLVFQYDTAGKTVLQAAGTLAEGVASAGGYRGSLSAAGDGNGLLSTEFSSGSGQGSTSRVTLDGDTLRSETLWEGNVFDDTDKTFEEIGSIDIDWHDVSDTSALGSWTPDAAPPVSASGETEPEPSAEPDAPVTDGDRIVFTGTLGAYSYNEVLALQGEADPNPGSDMGETYYLIVLDAPQTMNLRMGDGSGSREGEVHMVNVSYVEGITQYVGQNLTFSIDPNQTWWPSDTSLPLGEPSTDDIHILS